jgi:RHS repeat-associated protein
VDARPEIGSVGEGLIGILPGQYYDAEAGTSYNYYRDYDPAIGRYVESDPIGIRGGLNTYVYVNGQPLTASDPAGLAKICCHGAVFSFNPEKHCYIIADDGHTYDLQPGLGGGAVVGISRVDKEKVPCDGDPFECPGYCGVDQNACFARANEQYPIGRYKAKPGPNSNTYAAALARSCCKGGVPASITPDYAPGIEFPPPPPWSGWPPPPGRDHGS